MATTHTLSLLPLQLGCLETFKRIGEIYAADDQELVLNGVVCRLQQHYNKLVHQLESTANQMQQKVFMICVVSQLAH